MHIEFILQQMKSQLNKFPINRDLVQNIGEKKSNMA